MMAWLLECDRVSFLFVGTTLSAFVPPDAASGSAAQLEMLFRFCEGFVARIPEIVATEFGGR